MPERNGRRHDSFQRSSADASAAAKLILVCDEIVQPDAPFSARFLREKWGFSFGVGEEATTAGRAQIRAIASKVRR